MPDPNLLLVLDRLERAEASLLTWGYVDGGFTEEEVRSHIVETLDVADDESDDILEDLLTNDLVVRIRSGRRLIYRSRSAETMRLLARLRQLFPQHLANGTWRHAPTLVSDFRYSLRARRYPDRCLDRVDAIEAIAHGREASVRQAITALLDRGATFRLAKFQVDAANRILDDLNGSVSRGTIVGAGTGSGKTLAFYVPALAHVTRSIASEHWTKAIAVYPRNELLKDQFSETYTEARRLDRSLADDSKRKVLIGAFFGPTPHNAQALLNRGAWARAGNGFVCPYLRCPQCSGELIWSEEDIRGNRERLSCGRNTCPVVVGEDEVVLTRARMRRTPPDVLFTTTEMLNRQLSDTTNSHIFGVGPRARRKPQVMLLDEVHTYEGTTGAQAAYVIRRWRHQIGRPVQFVGLSATLREAQTFFGQLVGLPEHAVADITPAGADHVTEGMEYLVALRGDPVSGASLLSTTIQTAMLLRRGLDHEQGNVYGSRLFVFTDDLDVTNRLYFDLLDAEGRDSWGKPNPQGNGPLAALRSSTMPEHSERQPLGQAWDMCESLGHHLDNASALRIGRTSSQDPGVAAASDVIVATASLDVGFNDPTVGAVLQHKAPRDAAQFLQRKGRAGRIRGMRPWTVVVLSDYGRDRLAYQGYDLLFDPQLDSKSLPIRNTYVLRIQAAFALMDWLASKVPAALRGSMWLDLAGPPSLHQPRSEHAAQRQQLALDWATRALVDEAVRDDLLDYVRRALQLNEEQTTAVAWEAPRSLMLEVLPTLRRRLGSGWSAAGVGGGDYQVRWQPLPDFVPSNLFSDLNLPETRILLPPAQANGEETDTQAPVLQALRTFAPGRVSRRYGVEHRYVRHWVPVPLDSPRAELDLESFADGVELGIFSFQGDTGPERYRVMRPWTIRTERPPQRLLDSTNAILEWRSQLVPVDEGDEVDVPTPSAWAALARSLHVFLHARQSSVDISRIAVGSTATLAFQRGVQSTVRSTFSWEEQRAALGFTLDVDAIRMTAVVPGFFADGSDYLADQPSVRSFRAAYFEHLVQTDPALAALANTFQLRWISQLYLSIVVERALADDIDLETAHRHVTAGHIAAQLTAALDVIFHALPDPDDEGDDGDGRDPHRQRLHQALAGLAADAAITARLAQLARVLWGPPDTGWQGWAAQRYAATLGAALLEATDRLCRDVGAQNLIMDVEFDEPASVCTVWLSEPSLGGGGIVEEFARRYTEDPRRFFRLVEASLAPSDFEIVDSELSRTLRLAAEDTEVSDSMSQVRAATTNVATANSLRQLVRVLTQKGVSVTHPVMAALNARVLRPGSSSQSDDAIRSLVDDWKAQEGRLGVEIDARVFAYAASASSDIDRVIPMGGGSAADKRRRRFSTIYGLLWPRGSAVRANALQTYNPYHPHPPTDRALVLNALDFTTPVISLSTPDWRDELAQALLEAGTALLAAHPDATRELRAAAMELQGLPVDAGYLMLFPRVTGFDRSQGEVRMRFELREAFQ
ncbi:MAG TPA: protein DpdJ [Acidimicrobiales bacterium]|nr:protein DpdJ [Acidimicrobiales bacterium]